MALSSGYRARALTFAIRIGRDKAILKIAANAGWLLGDRVVRLGLAFVVGAWVARYLGPDQFGHLAYVTAFVAFFQAVANLGTDSIAVRDVAHDEAAAPEILGTVLGLRLIAGAVCWAAAVGLTALIDPSATETIAMTAIVAGVMVFQAADTVDLWFQSQVQSRRTVIAKLAAYLLTNGLKIALVLAKAPLIAFAATFLFDFIAAAVALAIAYRTLPTARRWFFDISRARALLEQSWPFLLSALSIMVYMRIDQIMLKALRGDHEVGIFAAALPLSQIWQMIPLTLVTSVAPYIARKKLAGEAAYERALIAVFRLMAGLSLAAAVGTALVAPILLPLVYGGRYAESVDVLRVLVFTNVFVAMAISQGLWIANERRGRLLLAQTVAGAVVAIAGNWLVIPIWGALGAALIAVLAQLTSSLLINLTLAPRLFRLQLGLTNRVQR